MSSLFLHGIGAVCLVFCAGALAMGSASVQRHIGRHCKRPLPYWNASAGRSNSGVRI